MNSRRFCAMTFAQSDQLADQFRNFIQDLSFPCVGAKSALARDQMQIFVARDIRGVQDDKDIYIHLLELANEYADTQKLFASLAVVFAVDCELSEKEFESCLWN